MAKKAPQWFMVLISALTANSETCGCKRRLRNAARGKALDAVQGQFVLWLLREFIPPCDEAAAVASLWERRLAGDEPTAEEWDAAGEEVGEAALAANPGHQGVAVGQMARSPALTTPVGQRSAALVEPTLSKAALALFQAEHVKAVEAAREADACDAAWSATMIHRPEAMRGVVTSAARTAADVPWAYGQMAAKLLELLAKAGAKS
jgi:hypothetical protein